MKKTSADEKRNERILRGFVAQKNRVKASSNKLKAALEEADRKLRSGPKG